MNTKVIGVSVGLDFHTIATAPTNATAHIIYDMYFSTSLLNMT